MNGDNFRPVDDKTAAWALKQHFAMCDMPINAGGPPTSVMDIGGNSMSTRDRMPRIVRQIVDTELSLQGVTWEEFSSVPPKRRGSQRIGRAAHAVYYAIRTQMTWCGEAPSESQIARWMDRHPSSVHYGLAIERARRESEDAA